LLPSVRLWLVGPGALERRGSAITASENHISESISPLDRLSQLNLEQLVELARTAFEAGQLDQVHTVCLLGLTRFPDSPELLAVLGWVYARRADLVNAETTFRHALSFEPDSIDAHAGLAAVLAAKQCFDGAEPHFERALQLNEHDACTLFNYGCMSMSQGRFDAAVDMLERAVESDPSLTVAVHNLAVASAQLGRWEKALAHCEQALAMCPDAWQLRMMRGIVRVALGSFADGWEDYEARLTSQDYFIRRLNLPVWRGPGDRRESIVVVPEQGIGTQIMFASCVAELAAHVPRCTLGCEPRLIGLFRRSFPTADVVASGVLPELAQSGAFDCQIMSGSLPKLFRRSADEFPGATYLSAQSERAKTWKRRLEALGPGVKIGMSWRGGALQPDARHRSTEIGDWQPLYSLPDIHWVNLQYDALPAELDAWRRGAGDRFHEVPDFDKKHDLENLAGLISHLDLVITVVNSTVHLAGALGTPTWAIVPVGGEWRWQASGEQCLWHSSVRLVRQERWNDWSRAFQELRECIGRTIARGRFSKRRDAVA
jgi:Flp pilus assembly protein TadD